MRKGFILGAALLAALSTSFVVAAPPAPVLTAKAQSQLTPDQVLKMLKAGNARFVKGDRVKGDLIKSAQLTANGQHPGAVILSCIDSRVPPEIIFDQNIGNVFVTRVAANVINKDVLGGLEFATKAAGAKLIVVMGHDSCGAVKGACEQVKMGNLTHLLDKVQPAILQTKAQFGGHIECGNPKFIDAAAKNNVIDVMKMIPKDSPVIARLVKSGQVKIIGAMYHLHSGKVTFFDVK